MLIILVSYRIFTARILEEICRLFELKMLLPLSLTRHMAVSIVRQYLLN